MLSVGIIGLACLVALYSVKSTVRQTAAISGSLQLRAIGACDKLVYGRRGTFSGPAAAVQHGVSSPYISANVDLLKRQRLVPDRESADRSPTDRPPRHPSGEQFSIVISQTSAVTVLSIYII